MKRDTPKDSKLANFEMLSKLGQGSFGVVYRVKRKADGKIYVLKQIDTSKMSSQMRKEAVHEATILSRMDSAYIVKYYDSFTEKQMINIVMELCENGDLGIYLKKQMGRHLAEQKIWKFFIEMCLGIQYLHANKILHRDIKTINMFLTKEDKVKIGDLGVAKMLNQTANFAHTVVGTPYYLSPELCEEKPYNHKSDIWSLGCVLYEICTMKHPFESNNQGALILKIVRGKYNPIPSQYSKELSNMVDKLLCKDYKKRPSIQEILEMVVMTEKATYFGYTIPKATDLKAQPKQQPQQTQPLKLQQQAIPSAKASASNQGYQANKPQSSGPTSNVNQVSAGGAQSAREKYYAQLGQAARKQPLMPIKEENPIPKKKEEKPPKSAPMNQGANEKPVFIQPVKNNNIPSSYVDPFRKNFLNNKKPSVVAQEELNNNKFDVRGHERKQQLNNQPQRRPVSSQQAPRQIVQEKRLSQQYNANPIQQNFPRQQAPSPKIQIANQQLQVLGSQQQPAIKNRVKSKVPQQLSRQAQQAQRMGQKLLKAGDNDRPPIYKPDVNKLKPAPYTEEQAVVKPVKKFSDPSKLSQEQQEVMNLPDDISKLRNVSEKKTAQEMYEEAIQKQKRNALARINSKKKPEDLSQQPAAELHEMKMIIPDNSDEKVSNDNQIKEEPSTEQASVEELVAVKQSQISEAELEEMLGEKDSQLIQPTWKLSTVTASAEKMRQTEFVPTYQNEEEEEEEVDLQVYTLQSSQHQKKMKTIKEEQNDNSDSDTAYFNGDEVDDLNSRDSFDSEEEKEFENRRQQLYNTDLDDEDHQPYDDSSEEGEDECLDSEQEKKRVKEEFGDEEEEEEEAASPSKKEDAMSMTMNQEKAMQLKKEIQLTRKRQEELKIKIKHKNEEGVNIAGGVNYRECLEFFCHKAVINDLSDSDMVEINEFVSSKNVDNTGILTPILLQAFYMQEELKSTEEQLQSLSQALNDLEYQ